MRDILARDSWARPLATIFVPGLLADSGCPCLSPASVRRNLMGLISSHSPLFFFATPCVPPCCEAEAIATLAPGGRRAMVESPACGIVPVMPIRCYLP